MIEKLKLDPWSLAEHKVISEATANLINTMGLSIHADAESKNYVFTMHLFNQKQLTPEQFVHSRDTDRLVLDMAVKMYHEMTVHMTMLGEIIKSHVK